MFVTTVCILCLFKLKWPMNKSLYILFLNLNKKKKRRYLPSIGVFSQRIGRLVSQTIKFQKQIFQLKHNNIKNLNSPGLSARNLFDNCP